MHNRCSNPNETSYPHYGGRGIKVCERWGKFENFLADMGERPPGLTLDREDNERDYGPDNCKWASRSEQSKNKRNNVHLALNGRTMCLTDWSREIGVPHQTLSRRLARGWDHTRTLTTKR
jgi:hypothetical protein